MTIYASTDDGKVGSWDPGRRVQVTSGPAGYSSLEKVQGASEMALLFEQRDLELCAPVLPSWAHAPDGTARGLGAESCKISFRKLPMPSHKSDDATLAVKVKFTGLTQSSQVDPAV